MNKKTVYHLLLCFVVCPMLWGQSSKPGHSETEHEASRNKKCTIPFIFTEHNNMAVQTVLNGKDTVLLMFHTAASAVTLIEEAVQKCATIHFNRTDTVSSWGGDGNASRYSEGNTLAIGKQRWQNVPIWENKNSGPGTDGKFGIDLFAGQTVQIDFNKKTLTVGGSLPDTKGYEKLKLITDNDLYFVEAACEIDGNVYSHRFLIHSGYSGTILLDDHFAAEQQLAQKLTISSTQELKDSYGSILKVQKGILPTFIIGRQRLSNIPVGFFEGALGRQKISMIGGDFLKRFTWILDAKREYVYMKRNEA